MATIFETSLILINGIRRRRRPVSQVFKKSILPKNSKNKKNKTDIVCLNNSKNTGLQFFLSRFTVVCKETNTIISNIIRINSVFCLFTTINLLLPHSEYSHVRIMEEKQKVKIYTNERILLWTGFYFPKICMWRT